MPNGYSRVTWIEHAEIEAKSVHQIFSHYVYSGMAFGAQRWLAVLQRQLIPSPEARKNMMKLSQRMLRTVCVNMSTSNGQSWTDLSDSPDDTVRITTRKVTDPGQPIGVILTAVSTTWLPYSHYCVFELLREERRRAQPDVLTNGNSLHEVARIANGSSWKLHFSFSHKCIEQLIAERRANATRELHRRVRQPGGVCNHGC
ncbi:hypothetical protein ACFX16_023265 [Malus domestica]